MIASPPQEAAQIRGKTLTPVSPKPVHYPSPANIPILEKQMDPLYQPMPHPDPLPADASQLYADHYASNNDPNAARSGAEGNGEGGFAESLGAGHGGNANDPPSTYPNFAQQHYSAAAAPGDSASAPTPADQAAAQNSYPPSYPGTQNPSEQNGNAPSHSFSDYPDQNGAGGGVDFQTILDNLNAQNSSQNPTQPPTAGGNAAAQSSQAASVTVNSPTSALPGNPNLPPRPPPQEKPATHPNYAPEDDIRSYHPHSQKNPGASYRAQGSVPPIMTGGANGASAPLSATQRTQSPNTPGYRQRDTIEKKPERDDEDAPWGPEVQKLYDEFLHDEREYVTEGQWDKFPPNSRLFIGNLPTEKVTKRDLFHIFHKHGKLAQISIKQAYGFVQFLDGGACQRALQSEQGMMVRGRKMHLEISKPQRNTRNAEGSKNDRNGRRRSRSPDYNRGGSQQGGRGVDRYTSAQGPGSPRDRDFRRGRDDYRPGRSPSPRGFRGGRDRSRDRFDGRRRSRSRSPYGGRRRYRSPTPRDLDDDLPLPRRLPQDVPDVQILVLDDLDRGFLQYIERAFRDRGLRVDVLILSPRLSEAAVVRRQIIEGVQAVVRLTRPLQMTHKIPLQVFDRRGGADNVRFEEYVDLDPPVAAELVVRAKQTHTAPLEQPGYSYGLPPQYGIPQAAAPVQQAAAAPNLQNLITSLDGAGLQKLLGAMGTTSAAAANPLQPQQPPTAGLSPDVARLLGTAAAPTLQQQQPPTAFGQQPGQANPYAALASNPALASILSQAGVAPTPTQPGAQPMPPTPTQAQAGGAAPSQPQQQQSQPQPNMSEIMAQLAKYNRR